MSNKKPQTIFIPAGRIFLDYNLNMLKKIKNENTKPKPQTKKK